MLQLSTSACEDRLTQAKEVGEVRRHKQLFTPPMGKAVLVLFLCSGAPTPEIRHILTLMPTYEHLTDSQRVHTQGSGVQRTQTGAQMEVGEDRGHPAPQ